MADSEWARRVAGDFKRHQEEERQVKEIKSLDEQNVATQESQLWDDVTKAIKSRIREFNKEMGHEVLALDPGYKGGWPQFRVINKDNGASMLGSYEESRRQFVFDKHVFELFDDARVVKIRDEGDVLSPDQLAEKTLEELLRRKGPNAEH
ncbi:MAG TPA: hypothetical protein VMX16_10900 [Terriglobia bacterium]|nr:hypothetical protein [Terriglobia bacterium]